MISEEDLSKGIIIPDAFDPRVVEIESAAVVKATIKSGVARV